MLKYLKISGTKIPLKYKALDKEEDAGEYDAETAVITLSDKLSADEHDETIVHEMVHAVQFNSSLRHTTISEDTWEVIAGEIGRAVSENFILIPKR